MYLPTGENLSIFIYLIIPQIRLLLQQLKVSHYMLSFTTHDAPMIPVHQSVIQRLSILIHNNQFMSAPQYATSISPNYRRYMYNHHYRSRTMGCPIQCYCIIIHFMLKNPMCIVAHRVPFIA